MQLIHYRLILVLTLLLALMLPAVSTFAAQTATIFVVNHLGDDSDAVPGDGLCSTASSTCTLRAAIEEANAHPNGTEADRIHFDLTVNASHRYEIDRSVIMPAITDPVVIDGTTQSDYVNKPVIVLDGILRQENGLVITAGNSTIRGLSIIYFREHGIHITTNGGNVIQGNYIGTDNTEDKGVGEDGIRIENSPNNLIGGTDAGARNVISGNGLASSRTGIANIHIAGMSSQNNIIQGNIIGLHPNGSTLFTNAGTIVVRGGSGTVIGGTTSAARNIIAGGTGIHLHEGAAVNAIIQGNFIGTDITGTLYRATSPIEITGATSGLTIGGTTGITPGGPCTGTCNVMTGSSGVLDIDSSGAENITIQGNYFNADVTGQHILYATSSSGSSLYLNIRDSIIGGQQPGAGNLIVGARSNGIEFRGTNVDIIGNYIGTNISGTAALSNRGSAVNVGAGGTQDIRIRNNVLSSNGGRGIAIGPGVSNVVVTGNYIGTDITGIAAMGNTFEGIYVFAGAENVTIGGTQAGEANVIAYNPVGIRTSQTVESLRILGNSIFNNTGVGIRDDDTPLPDYRINDVRLNNGTIIEGELTHTPNTTYRLEFFGNSICDASGSGEGETFLTSTSIVTDANGKAPFSASSLIAIAPTDHVTMTATSDNGAGRTTAFSRCAALFEADLAVAVTADQTTLNENDTFIYTLTVTNLGPDSANNIQVVDVLPDEVIFVSDNGVGAYNSTTGLWSVGNLAPGAERSLDITVTVADDLLGTSFSSTATITSLDQHDPYPQNQSASVEVHVGADLEVLQTADNNYPLQGSEINFVVTLRNNGPGTAANMVIQDMLPAGLDYVSHDESAGIYSQGIGNWSLGSLAPDEEAILSIIVAVDAQIPNQLIVNTASVTQSDFDDPDTDNNTAAVSIGVGGTDLAIAASVSNDDPDENDVIQLTLTATNLGTNPVDQVSVLDTLPTGLTFVSANATKGTYNQTTGIWAIGQLAVDETATLTIDATVAIGLEGATLLNSVSIETPLAPDLNAANDIAQTTIAVRPPFTCDKLRLFSQSLTDTRMHALLYNANPQTTTIIGSHAVWGAPDLLALPDAEMIYQVLGNVVFWLGPDDNSPTDSAIEGDFREGVASISGGQALNWSMVFRNLPINLSNYATIWDFAGSTIYVDHPLQEADCAVTLELPQQQAVFNVNTTADVNDGVCNVAHCSLREALAAARAVPGSTVNIPAGTYIRTSTSSANFSLTGIGTVNGAGPAQTIIDANGFGGVFNMSGGTTLVKNLTMRGGVTGRGGGISNELNGSLTLLNTVITNNRSTFAWQTNENVAGGGVANKSATVTIVNSDIYGNTASSAGGGGVSNHSGTLRIINSRIHNNTGFSNLGGGIGVQTATNQGHPTTTIINSAINNNIGTGIYSDRQDTSITNSTISGNSNSGIVIRGNSDNVLDLQFVTITDNGNAGLRDIGVHDHIYTLRGTIIANNTLTNGTPENCIGGRIVSEGYNLVSDDSCYFAGPDLNSLIDVDPLLGPLQDNGGGTLTHALLADSPAINHVPPSMCLNVQQDQRGIKRPQVSGCDIGAFELEGPSSFPLVHHVNSIVDTGDGLLEQDESVYEDITTLQVIFSEGMTEEGAGAASDPANYLLVAAGSDGVVQTAACGAPSGADGVIPIQQVSYVANAYRASLIVNNNQPLPAADYRFFVCARVESLDGRQLDGNQDGTAGDDFVLDFSVISQPTANFTVDSAADAVDASPGDGQCQTAANGCTLRAAIMEANALATPITIALPAGNYVLALAGDEEDAALTGDLDITGHVTIIGADAATTIIDANRLDRVFHILAGTATFRKVTLQGAAYAGGGGGIFNDGGDVLVANSIIRDNEDSGIANLGSASTRITHSVIADNESTYGAGLFNGYESEMEITNSLVQGNTAGVNGGGIFNFESVLSVINTTITGNMVLTEGGGGVYSDGGVASIRFSTIFDNHAETYGGGVSTADTGDVMQLFATIVAGNTSNIFGKANCGITSIQSQGYNLADDTQSCRYVFILPSDGYGVEVELGALGDYGGVTQAYNLLLGSPAIDAIPLSQCDLSADQRNVLRPQGERCDIGSFEFVTENPPAAPSNLAAVNSTLTTITLMWDDNADDETAFAIERAPEGTTAWTQIAEVAANITTYIDTTVECDTTHIYRVRAYRSTDGRYSEYTDTVEATAAACLAADLELGLIASTGNSQQGETFTYSLTVTNVGPEASGIVKVGTALPAGIHLVSANPSQGEYDAALADWTISNLPASGSATLILTVRTGGGTLNESVAYSVEIVSDSATDPDSTPDNDSTSEDDWATVDVSVACPPASALNIADGDVIGLIVALDAANGACFTAPVTISLAQNGQYNLLQAYDLNWNGLPSVSSEVNIVGNHATIARNPAQQTPRFRLFDISETGILTIDNLNITNGDTRLNKPPYDVNQHGGAIRSAGQLTIYNSRFTNNTGYRGGAIYNNGGTLFVTDSTFTDNHSNTYGGAITGDENTAVTTINRSTFDSNTANQGGALVNLYGAMTVSNSTFHENKTNYLSDIFQTEYGTVTFSHNTFHTTTTAVHNRFVFVSSTVTFKGNIIHAAAAENCDVIGGTVTSAGGNVITGNNWCGSLLASDQLNVDPMLGPLADNGGPTQTMSLLFESPAIDAVALAICTETEDQRGTSRPQNDACDAGAFEAYYFVSEPNAVPETNLYPNDTPTLNWGEVTWASGYHVQVDNNRNFSSPEYEDAELNAVDLSVTTSPLEDGSYYWRVRARRANGTWGAWSSIGSFVVDT